MSPDRVPGEASRLARDAQQPSCPASPGRRPRLVVRAGARSGRSSSKIRASHISGNGTSRSDRESRIEPVHMHLEHRISQRLLGRFQSQGFMYHDLSRACLAQTKGSLPLVYLLGRLCLYGHQATRLARGCDRRLRGVDPTGSTQVGPPARRSQAARGRGVHAAARRRFACRATPAGSPTSSARSCWHRRSGHPRATGPSREEGKRTRDHDPQRARSWPARRKRRTPASCSRTRTNASTRARTIASVKRPSRERRPRNARPRRGRPFSTSEERPQTALR